MKKTTKSDAPVSLVEEEEEYPAPLVYDFYDNTININCNEGSNVTIIFQTGKPKDGPP
jgi:hypothetical protein